MLILVIGVREPDLWTGGLDGGEGGVGLNGNATIVAAAGEAGVGVAQLHRTGGLRDNLPRFIVDVHGWEGMGYKAGWGYSSWDSCNSVAIAARVLGVQWKSNSPRLPKISGSEM